MPLLNNSTALLTHHMKEFNKQSVILIKQLEKNIGKGEFDIHESIGFCLGDIVFGKYSEVQAYFSNLYY